MKSYSKTSYAKLIKHENPYKRILIIQTAYIGDLVLTTPLFRAVRKLFPKAKIDVVAIPQTEDIVNYSPHINSVLLFDKRGKRRVVYRDLLRQIKQNNYDLGIAPHRSSTSATLMWRAGIKKRIGFNVNFSSLFHTDRVKWNPDISERERNLSLLTKLTNQRFSPETEIFFDINAMLAAQKFERKTPKHVFRIAIAPGSVWATKRWPEEYFSQLVKSLKDNDFYFVFIGSNKERSLCRRIIRSAGLKNAVNLAGKTSLLEAAAIIDRCDLFVGNDSGAMHLANAVETDVIAMFGPTVQEIGFSPFRKSDSIFEYKIDCRPCGKHGGSECPKKHFKCMKNIDPELISEEIQQRAIKHQISPKRKDQPLLEENL